MVETIFYVCLLALFVILGMGLILLESWRCKAAQETAQSNKQILDRLNALVESQRLSVILKLEPASLKISPEQFEPNKEGIKARMFQVLEQKKSAYRNDDQNTYAYVVLNHSGWDNFVTGETRGDAQAALARLLANGDENAVKAFIEELVDKL